MSESQDPAGRNRWDPLVDAELTITPSNLAPTATSDQARLEETPPAVPEPTQ